MNAIDRLAVIIGKKVVFMSSLFHLGAGETWPGEVALMLRPDLAKSLAGELSDGVIIVAGTNGKTTTSLMLKTILEHVGEIVVHNATGANLLNGVVSSFIREADWLGRLSADVGIFEVDENSLPIILRYIAPKRIVLLNLFRDQLDRYGEVDVIVEKWQNALQGLPKTTELILNSDDPGIAVLGKSYKGKVTYFGLNDVSAFIKTPEHATDSLFCPVCGTRLTYSGTFFSHIGHWKCKHCGFTRPKPDIDAWPSPLTGLYNRYNTLAAVAAARSLGVPTGKIKTSLVHFSPAFGRQEVIKVDGRNVKLFLSKNPAGFNATLRTIIEEKAHDVLMLLNDRIPDGRDVSWIWDVDFETLPPNTRITVSGDRVYDMAIRIKYADVVTSFSVEPDMSVALRTALSKTPKGQTLYILPTYSAMLEARKLLTGRKIL